MNRQKLLLYKSNALNALFKSLRSIKKRKKFSFLNEHAAVDIASILIAVIVLGTIGTVIATTIFVVIPWAQDEAAKNQLKSIMAAEQAYAGMAATENVSGQKIGSLYTAKNFYKSADAVDPTTLAKNYGTLADLINSEMFDPAFMPEDASDVEYGEQMLSRDKSLCVVKLDAGAGYEAAIRSASGNVFVTNDNWVGPYKVPETSPVCLGRVLGEYVDYEGKVIIPPTVTPIEEMDPHSPAYSETPAEDDGEVAGEDEVVTGPLPVESPTPTPTASSPATTAPTSAPSPLPSSTTTPIAVTPEQAPEPPAPNKDPNTKKFMFCHMGAMHSNNFNGMVNGHHGHAEDIMPPIPFKNYVGWNWNAETAKIYYNNCQPVK